MIMTAIGYLILVATALLAFRHPRVAVYGMVICDNLRPQDPHIRLGFDSVKFSITYFAIGLLTFLLYYKKFRLTSDRFHWSILIMFLAVMNSAIFAPCYDVTLPEIDRYFKMFLQYYLICAMVRDEREMRELFWAIGLTMLVVSLQFMNIKFVTGELPNVPFEGATGDRNEMAMAVNMALPFILILGLTSPKRWVKLACFGMLGPMTVCVFFSGSRGGMLGYGAVMGYTLYRLHHKRWLIVLAVIVGLAGVANLPSTIVMRFATIFTATKKDASTIGRLNAWAAARNIIKDRPLMGAGTGNFLVYFKRYAPDPNDVHVAHSSFYQLMGEQGFPGLLTWIYLVAMCWLVATWLEMRLVRLNRGRWDDARYMLVAIKASWVGYVLCGMFLSQEDMDFFYHLVAMVSRYGVFVGAREAQVYAERKAAQSAAVRTADEQRKLKLAAGY